MDPRSIPRCKRSALRGGVLALALVLLACLLSSPVNGAIWPLTGYEACESQTLSGPWSTGDGPSPTGVALDSDNDMLWAVAGGTLYKYRYSTGSVLSTYDLQAPEGGAGRKALSIFSGDAAHYSVTLSEPGQVALTNGKDPVIYVFSSDSSNNEIFPVEEIQLSIVPLSVAYDSAYERFYVTNALLALDSAGGSIPPGTSVFQIDGDATQQLFAIDYVNLLGGNSISDIHYATNTGTLFILCSECSAVLEVTLSGGLRNIASSTFDIPASSQAPAALSLARTGHVMIILRDGMVLDSFCQNIVPSLPVLPPDEPYKKTQQTWYPIDSYAFCGFTKYDEIDNNDVTEIVLDPSTRTNWMLVGGKLRQYDWTGGLLRELGEAQLAGLGLTGITSMSFYKPRRLLLGLQTGNRLVVLDTAPVDYVLEFEGDVPPDNLEPPGPDAEAEFYQQINAAEVVAEYAINDATLAADSLGAIFYVTTDDSIRYSAVGSRAVFKAELGQPGDVVVVGQSADIDSLDVLLYSPVQDSYLMWCNSCSKLVQVIVNPEIAEAERTYVLGGAAGGMTMTPDGSIMIFATTSGEVSYFCGNADGSSGVITRSASGEDPDVNPLYFWQLQQLQQAETGDVATVTDRSVPVDFTVPLTTLFGVACGDPDYFVWPLSISSSATCENHCHGLLSCNAYTWDFIQSRCALKTTCDSQETSATSISGVKQSTFFAPPPAAASPPPPPPPPPVNTPGTFQNFPGIRCKDATLGEPIRDITAQQCKATCANNPQCGAYTSNQKADCFLKTACNIQEVVPGDFSGVKPQAAVQPFRPVNNPSPSPAISSPSAPLTMPPPAISWVYQVGFGCKDPSLGPKTSGVDQPTCQALCTSNPQCMAYTINQKGNCFLKATCNNLVANSNDFTGVQSSSPSPGSSPADATDAGVVTWEIYPDVGCKDANLGDKLEDVTQQGCQDACAATPLCNAFTHNTKNDCFLKAACANSASEPNDVTGIKQSNGSPATLFALPPPPPAITSLVDGWEWLNGQVCEPWLNPKCGLGANPGLKVGDITWYRMFAHKANPISDLGDGIVEWTPYRERKTYGGMYWKGSEILGYFDEAMPISKQGDKATVTFLWSSAGQIQEDICGSGLGSDIDCDKCEDEFDEETGEKYIYHETRCFSGTGDFRVALLDTSQGERITKDGYGYFNKKVQEYLGMQWRFHPQACPTTPREYPFGYAAVGTTSWYRNAIVDGWLNSQGLVNDFIEEEQDDWYPELGETRSFEERLFDPAEEGACLNLENGEFTPEDKPFRMTLTNLGPEEGDYDDDDDDNDGPMVKFEWKMEFNGWTATQIDSVRENHFPSVIDGIVIGYTNPRSYNSMKLKRID